MPFTRLLACLLTVYLLISIWDLLAFTGRMGTKSTELRLPMIWIYGTMFTGLALTALYFLLEFVDGLRATIRNTPSEETTQ